MTSRLRVLIGLVLLQSVVISLHAADLLEEQFRKLPMEDCGGHYATGIFGHRALYTVLNDYGHAGVTRHLSSITDYPSLGFLTEKHDLTTWPESPHNGDATQRYRRNSFNHPMHSGLAAAFHESFGGIRTNPASSDLSVRCPDYGSTATW